MRGSSIRRASAKGWLFLSRKEKANLCILGKYLPLLLVLGVRGLEVMV